nr:hypothetical protein [Tanacetum cinerariifolium]
RSSGLCFRRGLCSPRSGRCQHPAGFGRSGRWRCTGNLAYRRGAAEHPT